MDNSLGRKFVDLIFKNGQIVALFFAFLVIGGVLAFATSHAKGFPDVKINIAFVTIPYPGATATQVEEQVIKPIESTVANLKNVTEYSSTSADSFGMVSVTFDDRANYDDSIRDLSAKLARLQLPEGASDPEIADISAGGGFDFLVGVTGPTDPLALYTKTNYIKNQLESIKGIAKVAITNPLKPEARIVFDANQLAAKRITRAQVEASLKLAQLDFPVGSFVDEAKNKINVGISKDIDNLEQIRDLAVAPGVRLADVASVEFVLDDQDKYNRIGFVADDRDEPTKEGTLRVAQAQVLSIEVKDNFDILAMADTLEEKYADLTIRSELGGDVKIVSLFNQADSTREQVDEIKAGLLGKNIEQWGPLGVFGYLLGGIALVIILLLVFINWRVALLASLSIPLALGVGMLYLKLANVELNTLVLFSMVLVIGLVVDPTIVFLEALYRYRQQGYGPIEAATKTINSVGFGVALSAITNFAVFLPFGVVSGFFGQIIRYIPLTVIPAIIASFLVPAIFFMPVAARWLKLGNAANTTEEQELVGAWRFSKWLGRTVKGILAPGKAWLRVMIIVLAIIAPFAVAGGTIGSGAIKFVQFSSQEDSTVLMVSGTVPSVWSFEKAVGYAGPLQSYLAKQPEIKDFVYYQQDGNSFTILAQLWPIEDRQAEELRTSTALAKDLNSYFATISDITVEALSDNSGPPADRFPIKLRIFDADTNKLQAAAEDAKNYLKSQAGVIKVEDSLTIGSSTISGTSLILDSKNPLTLNPFAVIGVIKDKLDVTEVAKYEIGANTWSLMSSMNPQIKSIEEIKDIPLGPGMNIGSATSQTLPQTAKTIQRLNGQRYVEVRANVAEDTDPLQVQADLNKYFDADKLESFGLAEDATESKGAADSIAQSFTDLLVSLLIALFIIYVLLVGFFRSLMAPLIIMFAIPLGLVGVFPAVAASTGQLGFLELLGVVAMAGIVVNVTILIIDFANQLMAQGKTAQEAISTSIAVRYKAIFLTKVTIFAGLMPLAIFSPFWRGLALVMIFGIIVSAILSMFTTPIFYVWSKGRDKRMKNRQISKSANGDGEAMGQWPQATGGEAEVVTETILPDNTVAQGEVLGSRSVGQQVSGEEEGGVVSQQSTAVSGEGEQDGPSEDEIRELLNRIIQDRR
jgi:HAE1 family hydrophobic/amphiphilic exporter-1